MTTVQTWDVYGLKSFEVDGNEYAIAVSDLEADEACKKYIEDSAWAFTPEFIIDHSNLPYEALEMIKEFQAKKCEDANETILALINDFNKFISDAISADGRGHFLSGYDGEEKEWNNFLLDLSLDEEEASELLGELVEELDLTEEEIKGAYFYRTN